jgi:hypothetical protein
MFAIIFALVKKFTLWGWASVAHASNPSYSGGRDQENSGSKPDWEISLQDPISKMPNIKKGWQSACSYLLEAWGSEFKL